MTNIAATFANYGISARVSDDASQIHLVIQHGTAAELYLNDDDTVTAKWLGMSMPWQMAFNAARQACGGISRSDAFLALIDAAL